MKPTIFKMLIIFMLPSTIILAQGSNRSLGGKRNIRISSANSSGVSTQPVEANVDLCPTAFKKCMTTKLNELIMANELFFDDYSDMLSEVYGGTTAPEFKCMFSENVKDLYTKYHYGVQSLSEPSGSNLQKIRSNSIEYYKALKQNASDVVSKKLTPAQLMSEIVEIAQIDIRPIGQTTQELPIVSYKTTVLQPTKQFKLTSEYCLSPETNKSLTDCEKPKAKSANDWKNEQPNTLAKSCADYEVFLAEQLKNEKESSKNFIMGLRSKLANTIEEYNAKIEANRILKNM